MESRVDYLEKHIEKLNDHLEEWRKLAAKKDEIIDTYKELLHYYTRKLEEKRNDNTQITS